MLATALLCATLATAPAEARSSRLEPPPSFLMQGGVAAAAGVVGVPIAFYAARFVGTLSNQLIWALVPSLLVLGFLPAALVSVASWLTHGWLRDEDEPRARFVVPFLVTTAVNIAVMVLGGFLGVSLANASAVVALTLVDAVAMAAGNVGTMRALQPAQPSATATVPSSPSMAAWVAVSSVSF